LLLKTINFTWKVALQLIHKLKVHGLLLRKIVFLWKIDVPAAYNVTRKCLPIHWLIEWNLAHGTRLGDWIMEAEIMGGNHGWIPHNLNEGHLDYFFCLLAGLNFLDFVVHMFCETNSIARKHLEL
jgi:hypothetical protein